MFDRAEFVASLREYDAAVGSGAPSGIHALDAGRRGEREGLDPRAGIGVVAGRVRDGSRFEGTDCVTLVGSDARAW